jgi:hypothetical protein
MAEELPRRNAGTHLPREAYRAAGRARVPNVDPAGRGWYVDEKTLRMILNALRRWQINDRAVK